MTEDKMTPLRERMMEDMRIRGMGDKAQIAFADALVSASTVANLKPRSQGAD
jgi:hypothetical protein